MTSRQDGVGQYTEVNQKCVWYSIVCTVFPPPAKSIMTVGKSIKIQ